MPALARVRHLATRFVIFLDISWSIELSRVLIALESSSTKLEIIEVSLIVLEILRERDKR